jgi:osmotically-inducible protein OsmY
MKRLVSVFACAAVLALGFSGGLGGCSAYQAHRKCGNEGCAGDAQITQAVEAIYAQHAELGPPNHVYVKTSDGVVFLTGKVATDLQRTTAESLARGAPGVRQVVNSLATSYEGR